MSNNTWLSLIRNYLPPVFHTCFEVEYRTISSHSDDMLQPAFGAMDPAAKYDLIRFLHAENTE